MLVPQKRLKAIRAAAIAMTILETGQRPGTIIAWSDMFFDLAGRRIDVPRKMGRWSFQMSNGLIEAIGLWRQEAAAQDHELDPTMFRRPASSREREFGIHDPASFAIRKLLREANPDMVEPIQIHTLIAAYKAGRSEG